MPVVTMPDGTPVSFPDAMPPDQIRGMILQKFPDAAQQAQPESTGDPSLGDYARANPIGGAAHTVLRAGQGIEQLIAHGAADLSDFGGHAPNSLANLLHAVADHVDATLAQSEKGYQGSKSRVVNASTNPRVTNAAINTGEVEGNLLNPAGLAGNTVRGFEAAAPVVNAGIRGAVSGGAVAATQPVDNPENFYAEKGKQTATGVVVGGATGATAEALGGKTSAAPPTTKDLKTQASDAYKDAERQGVVIRQDSFKKAVTGIRATTEKAGMDEDLTPKSVAVLNRFDKEAEQGPITLEKAETLRKVANSALDSPDKSDRRIAHIIIDKLDDHINNLSPQDMEGTGSMQGMSDAHARLAKSKQINGLVEAAKESAGPNADPEDYVAALRKQFRALARDPAAMNRFGIPQQQLIRQIDRGGSPETLQNIMDVSNAQGAIDSLNTARDLYARSAKSATVDRLVEKAKNAVGANYTAAGMDTALRQQFRALANNQNALGRFSPEEQAAILKIVRGSPTQNMLRLIGKLSPNSTFPIASELAVAGSGHGDVAAGMALGGAVAKEAAARMGKSNVNTLSELVRRGNALAAPRPAPNAFVGNPTANLAINALLQPRAQ